jgi:hypothetical protein
VGRSLGEGKVQCLVDIEGVRWVGMQYYMVEGVLKIEIYIHN